MFLTALFAVAAVCTIIRFGAWVAGLIRGDSEE